MHCRRFCYWAFAAMVPIAAIWGLSNSCSADCWFATTDGSGAVNVELGGGQVRVTSVTIPMTKTGLSTLTIRSNASSWRWWFERSVFPGYRYFAAPIPAFLPLALLAPALPRLIAGILGALTAVARLACRRPECTLVVVSTAIIAISSEYFVQLSIGGSASQRMCLGLARGATFAGLYQRISAEPTAIVALGIGPSDGPNVWIPHFQSGDLGTALWIPLWLTVPAALLYHMRRLRSPNQCPTCKYDTRGLPSRICPECGAAY